MAIVSEILWSSQRYMNKICINLSSNHQITCESICQKIQNLINNISKDNKSLSDKILVVSIQDVSDHSGDNPIPKIEHKEIES